MAAAVVLTSDLASACGSVAEIGFAELGSSGEAGCDAEGVAVATLKFVSWRKYTGVAVELTSSVRRAGACILGGGRR